MYSVRPYSEGDESSLLSLYTKYYGDYAGFVPRTLQHWLWCCKLHPDIGPEGIFVACGGKEVVGYAVVGRLSQQEGGFIIYELCYDPVHDGKVIVSRLIERVSLFVEEKGGNYMTFPAPTDDLLVRKACDELGFTLNPLNEVIGFVILDLTEVIKQIIKARQSQWKGEDEAYLIQLTNSPFPYNVISIRLMTDDFSVSNEDRVDDTKVVIQTDFTTLNEIIFGGKSVLKAMLESQLVIKPRWRIRKSLRLFAILSLGDQWYIPRLDQI